MCLKFVHNCKGLDMSLTTQNIHNLENPTAFLKPLMERGCKVARRFLKMSWVLIDCFLKKIVTINNVQKFVVVVFLPTDTNPKFLLSISFEEGNLYCLGGTGGKFKGLWFKFFRSFFSCLHFCLTSVQLT